MKKKGVMRGSYTIEAAVLLSMITFVLAALILTAFYLHDRSVCQSTAALAILYILSGTGNGRGKLLYLILWHIHDVKCQSLC